MKQYKAIIIVATILLMIFVCIMLHAYLAITENVSKIAILDVCALLAAQTIICAHFGTIVMETSKLNESFNNWIVYGMWIISIGATLLVIYLSINPQPEMQLL